MNLKNKTRREFLKTAGIGTASLALAGSTGILNCQKKTDTPNIVIIFIDDMGYADLGCFGAKGFETPNIDQMAAEGIKFTSFYVSQAVCSASRASLLTGCYSERVGVRGAYGPFANVGLHPDEDTIADVLQKKGYTAAVFGKWHLGHHKKFLPLNQGFDEYLGIPYSNDMWPVHFDGTPITEGNKSKYPQLPLIEGNEKIEEIRTLEDQATLTSRYTERSVQFIEKNKDKPFFLYVPHSMVHVPLGVSEKFRGKSEQGMYGDVMMEIDWSVGEILNTLKKHNLDENTLVVFTSDNGPWLNFGNHSGLATPLREGKGTMWEGGARVPCIMRWPGQIPAGIKTDNIAATIDLLPTIAAVTGAPLPEKPIDGVNILPVLTGDEQAVPRNSYFYYYGGELRAVRQGKWKLFFPHKTRSYVGVEPGNDRFPGPYSTLEVGSELYDLENDIGETKNVIDQHTDVVEELQQVAKKARQELGDRLTNTLGKGVRTIGRLEEVKKGEVKHLAIGKKISLKNSYSPKYTGGKKDALIDGIQGTSDHMDGSWQGFEGDDLEATIDLGAVKSIKQISCGFLESHASWIFLPEILEIAVSKDGITFKVLAEYKHAVEAFNPKAEVRDFNTNFDPEQVQFIRIKAKNIGTCPDWHQGAGGKAWIFADEFVVR